MKLGIYGGTFDPIHNAHVRVANAFLEEFSLDKLMIIPTGVHPRKNKVSGADPKKRLEMCRLAFEGYDKICVSDIEIKQQGVSYTAHTLKALSSSGTDMYMLCGTDMILSLGNWFMADEIFKLCTVVYVRRENEPENDLKINSKISEYKAKYNAVIEKLEIAPSELSSEMIRAELSRGRDVSGHIPVAVHQFIKENKLYLIENE